MESSRRWARSVALASFLGIALVSGAALEVGFPEEAEAGYDIDESYFYSSLAPHGSWVQNAQFGWVWYPNHRPRNWRPYTVGRWAWTDSGEWMWVSDEPYGWATYHYGRWFLDPFFGWVWLPGRVWAPAWVSWRDCDDYVGWAPLSPWGYYDRRNRRYRDWDRWNNNRYDNNHGGYHGNRGGIKTGHASDHDGHGGYSNDRDDRDDWTFTRKRDFGNSRVDRVMLDRHKQADVYRRSRDLPPPSEQDERMGRGVARGIDRGVIERASGRPIRPVKVEDDNAPPGAGGKAMQRGGDNMDRVRVYRPKVSGRKSDAPTPDRLGIAKPSVKRPERPSGSDRQQGADRNPRPTTGKQRDEGGSANETRPSGRGELSPGKGGQSRDSAYSKSNESRSPEPRGGADKPRGGRYEVPTAVERQEQGRQGSPSSKPQAVERGSEPRPTREPRQGGSYSAPRQKAPSVDRASSSPPSERASPGGGSPGGGRETMRGGGSPGGSYQKTTSGGGKPGETYHKMPSGGGGAGSPQGRSATPPSGGNSGGRGHGGQNSQGSNPAGNAGTPVYGGAPPVGR
jgi:hypothetical protein